MGTGYTFLILAPSKLYLLSGINLIFRTQNIDYTIGVVNKGRNVTLKYFIVLIRINKEHRLFIGPGQSKRLIYINVK